MNRITNPILLIIPAEALGLLVVGGLILGGMAIMVGARQLGSKLVISAVALPFIMVAVEVLMNAVFEAVPEFLILPIAFLITMIVWIMLFWALLRLFFGNAVVDNAQGILLADAIRGGARPLVSHPLVMVAVIVGIFAFWQSV